MRLTTVKQVAGAAAEPLGAARRHLGEQVGPQPAGSFTGILTARAVPGWHPVRPEECDRHVTVGSRKHV